MLGCCGLLRDSLIDSRAELRSYTVKAGDSLWKIAQQFYGNGSQYPKIIAGRLQDEKTVIHPGDVLVVPE